MLDIDRRSALAIGFAGLSGLVLPEHAAAQTYGPNEGKELTQGVRQIDLGERESLIPAYKKVRLSDIVLQPGAKTPDNAMMNDMLCHMTEGELAVVQNDSSSRSRRATCGPAPRASPRKAPRTRAMPSPS
jgi:hypothetical protein